MTTGLFSAHYLAVSERGGYRVECFGSAEDFHSSSRWDVPGCAVLDLQMTGPSRLQLQETLAEGEEPLPVVFLTAHGDVSSSVRAMKAAAVDFLTKPVRGDDLLEAAKRALDRGAVDREGRPVNLAALARTERWKGSKDRSPFLTR
jgi:FixJ family two-component response regulator